MRIVNRQEFLALPPNTLYSKFRPIIFDDLEIKGETTQSGNDFWSQPIAGSVYVPDGKDFNDVVFELMDSGVPVVMDFDSEYRDGILDENQQLFAVYDEYDVRALIVRLQKCLSDHDDTFWETVYE